MSDTKKFSDFLLDKKCLGAVEAYFHLDIRNFKQIQHKDEIDGEESKEIWLTIDFFLMEVKNLKRVLANVSNPLGLDIQGLSRAFWDVYGFEGHIWIDEVTYYIQSGGLYEDLDDLERLLYFLLHTNAKKVHLSCA